MGKRSSLPRLEKDKYMTFDRRALPPLLPHLTGGASFYEPCVGEGDLYRQLVEAGLTCSGHSDLYTHTNFPSTTKDALSLTKTDLNGADYIITNPPWSRKLLHPMIAHFASLAPTWLLFDSNWHNTLQAEPYLKFCTDVVVVGRLIWIPETTMSGKDDVSWFKFDSTANHNHPPFLHGRTKR